MWFEYRSQYNNFIALLQENLFGADLRNIKAQGLTSGSSRPHIRKQLLESASFSDSKSTEASATSMDEFCAVDSASVPSTSRAAEVRVVLSISIHSFVFCCFSHLLNCFCG